MLSDEEGFKRFGKEWWDSSMRALRIAKENMEQADAERRHHEMKAHLLHELRRQADENFGIVVGEVEGVQLMVDGYVDIDALVRVLVKVR